jgi:2-polyprenyl-6-methoxyphenol hydroxylase-like FAD-dependent oxidoreductase
MAPRIAILGAGPSGLMLASVLLHNNFTDFILFEGEATAHIRNQGGTLDLHPQSGQRALREAGLFDEFEKIVRYEGEDFILADKTGKTHVKVVETERGRPEVDRTQLRDMLIASLPAEKIKWGKRAKHVEIGKITFQDGTEESGFELIVGADGAWSKVRQLLTHVPPFYSGISGLEIRLPDVDKRHPRVAEMCGKGSCFVFGGDDKNVMLMQRQGGGSVRIYACGSKPEGWVKEPGYDLNDQDAVKAAFKKDYAAWAPEQVAALTDFDTTTGDEVIPRVLYMLPVGIRWAHTPGVTLLGDAAHLMTPFAGEGMNQALQDGMELALQILKDPKDLNTAVKTYEAEMFPRTTEETQKTWNYLMVRFGPDGIKEFKSRFVRMKGKMKERGATEEMLAKIYIAED